MMADERWLPIPGHEGRYEVSDFGRVRSLDRTNFQGSKIKGKIVVGTERPERNGTTGYLGVSLHHGGRRTMKVHDLVALAFLGPKPSGYQVNHKDGNKQNNRVENLEYVTHSQNAQHATRLGLNKIKRGELHKLAKLTEEKVREIRSRKGENTYTLADEYGVSQHLIMRVQHRKAWKHIT